MKDDGTSALVKEPETVIDMEALQFNLRVTFRNASLLEQACVHPSYLNENPSSPFPSNERLAFLGDSVLELVVAENLFQVLPSMDKGEMSKLRDSLINGNTLAALAISMRLGQYLCLGKGEEKAGGRKKRRNLATALEAVIGALYLDQGYSAARLFIMGALKERLAKALEGDIPLDYKSRLQELAQAKWGVTPEYRVAEASGPEHAKKFTVEAYVGDRLVGQGQGRSKGISEMLAAKFALQELEKISS